MERCNKCNGIVVEEEDAVGRCKVCEVCGWFRPDDAWTKQTAEYYDGKGSGEYSGD